MLGVAVDRLKGLRSFSLSTCRVFRSVLGVSLFSSLLSHSMGTSTGEPSFPGLQCPGPISSSPWTGRPSRCRAENAEQLAPWEHREGTRAAGPSPAVRAHSVDLLGTRRAHGLAFFSPLITSLWGGEPCSSHWPSLPWGSYTAPMEAGWLGVEKAVLSRSGTESGMSHPDADLGLLGPCGMICCPLPPMTFLELRAQGQPEQV